MAEINADAQEVITLLGQRNSDLAVENAILNARLREAARRLDALEADPATDEGPAEPKQARKRVAA